MNRILFIIFLPFVAACGQLDRSAKDGCVTTLDCVEGSCVDGACQELAPEPNSSIGELEGPEQPSDELPGARDAVLDSIARPCEADAECADGLHCIEGSCVCCEIVLENTNGDGQRCQDTVTPADVDACVPRVGYPREDEFEHLGKDCGSHYECAGELLCVGDGTCSNVTLRGCEGDWTFEFSCMCCARILSSDEPFPGAFECSSDPQFYRENCDG